MTSHSDPRLAPPNSRPEADRNRRVRSRERQPGHADAWRASGSVAAQRRNAVDRARSLAPLASRAETGASGVTAPPRRC
jgi:hypothetical protein